jgi:general secretion pathway protein D
MQILLLSRIKYLLSILLILGLTTVASARNCEARAFNIKVATKVSSYDILNQLSSECGFSMLSIDSVANDKLNEKLYGINIYNMKLDDIFKLLISSKGLQYKYDKNVLKISGLITRTFKIDYVNSERKGSSNTDISMNGDSEANREFGTTISPNSPKESNEPSLGAQTTGATITSSDSFKFWSTIQKELHSIINSPLDKFKAPDPIINKEAGLVTVSGTASQVRRIASYLDNMMRRLHKQVTIDVKILSVRLDNSKSTGIDWSQLYNFQNVTTNYESINSYGVAKIEDNMITKWGTGQKDYGKYIRLSGSMSIQNILNFLNTQGNVSSMSNPKITTMNNQPAIFSSGEQLYYKILQSVSQVSSGGSATGQNEVVRSVFAGVLLDITPEITDNDEIILKINPSISSINGQVQTQNGVRVIPPDLKKQQMSAVVKLKDGERIVLGGLISSSKGKSVKKVPILGNLPLLGNAFKQDVTTDVKEELVIIITPHIVNPFKKVSLKTLGYEGTY